ncbi:MAG: anti-sigma factor [Actinobacteria bacterium]|nr:anti-sigma factor [Actinomycetota bacterium]
MSVHELLPLYVIDSLPTDERVAFDAHLGNCAACQFELESYGPVLDALATEVAVTPDPELRDRVLAQIADVRQEDPIAGPASDDAAPAAVIPLERRRVDTGPRRWLAVAAAVLAFALVAATTTGVALWQRTNRLEEQLAETADLLEEQRGRAQQVSELATVLSAPDARLVDVDTDLSGDLRVAVSDSEGTGVVVADELEAPPQDRVYQLWLVGEGDPRSAGVVARTQRSGVVGVLSEVGDAQAVAISVEPPSGSDTPTGPIVGEAPLN